MVSIGKTVKYDDYGRVTLPAQLAELLNLIKGEDEVIWGIEDGKVCLFKVTKTYPGGFNFESKEIEIKLREYENKFSGNYEVGEIDLETAERRAREEYEKDKVVRAALKGKKR